MTEQENLKPKNQNVGLLQKPWPAERSAGHHTWASTVLTCQQLSQHHRFKGEEEEEEEEGGGPPVASALLKVETGRVWVFTYR
ncbi:hypothetical protein DAPPUDRAFT_245392 [Daphnia pulex]|uniref:Uncharacterized protein n=1 Tax=Daphnia pulex TaxID=6669 RepID=E9GN93_DAPPU|nr:hypothetical protein DAPPUDRAFT_245392 [Daphnia pulex]|eukprot:EFX78996.1 hypothetical protein DAPPUDRAFT_245392 [Daphnia pulex]